MIDRQLVLIFRDNFVRITPTTEMGGGVDGYFVQDKAGHLVASFNIPYYPKPEDEWKALSDYGKDEVRAKGWSNVGDSNNAIAAGLVYLGVTSGSKELEEYLAANEAKMSELKAEAQAEADALFDLDKPVRFPTRFDQCVEEYRSLGEITKVARNLERYTNSYKQAWSSWPVPATND